MAIHLFRDLLGVTPITDFLLTLGLAVVVFLIVLVMVWKWDRG